MAVINIYGAPLYKEFPPLPPALDIANELQTVVKPSVKVGFDIIKEAVAGTSAFVTPVPANKEVVLVHAVWSFSEDYYNRIHIVPTSINVGNLTSDQTISIEVFNAYFVPKNLISIDATGDDGIEVTGPTPPYTFPGLFSATYTMTVTTNGSPEIDALYVFNWGSARDMGQVTVTGSRIVMMPYFMVPPTSETLEWKTQVIKSYNNTEQRIRLRKHPRQSYNAQFHIPAGEMGRAQNLAYGWLSRRWAVPQWPVAQQSIGTFPIGSSVFNIDTTVSDYRVGNLIALWSNERANATAEILSLTPTSIIIDKGTSVELVNPWVMPANIAQAKGSIKRRSNGYNGALTIEFEFTNYKDLLVTDVPDQYKGNDIYYIPSLFAESGNINDEFNTRVDTVDYSLGVQKTYSPWRNAEIARPYRVVLQGLAEIWAFRKWLHRRAGKIKPFWTPTFENDLRISQSGTLLTSLVVKADDYKLFGSARKHIAIKTVSGVYLPLEIVAVSDSIGDTVSLTLDSALNIEADQVKEISFMGLKRLDNDRVELSWATNRTAECVIRMVEIQP